MRWLKSEIDWKMKTPKFLFLDDIRNPLEFKIYQLTRNYIEAQYEDWQIVRNYSDFVNWIEAHGLPEFISFDHDLGLPQDPEIEEENGMTCARWLVNYCIDHNLKLPDFMVHSFNPVGKRNIEGFLKGYQKCYG